MSNYLNSFQLNDHHALVTGAGRGLGEACALALSEAGAEITLVARSSDQLESVAKKIRDSGGQASVHPADLTKMEEIRKLEELGPFTILVNNAGINRPQSFEDVKENDFDDVLDLNVKSSFFVAQSVARGMIQAGRGGSIINMGSISWHLALEFMPAYTSSKAAIEGLTVGLARSYGKDRIRVNCIIPGSVRTPRQVKEILTPEYEKFITGQQCLPDQVLPEDIAQLALFLASDAGRMCTRRNFFMDAGIGA